MSVIYRRLLHKGQLYSKYKARFSGCCLVTVIYRVTAIDRAVIAGLTVCISCKPGFYRAPSVVIIIECMPA